MARRYGVARSTLQAWVARAGSTRLDQVECGDASRALLGDHGAVAIRDALLQQASVAPSLRTVHRILERRGPLDAGPRVRRPPPPPGWYLPKVAAGKVELDSFDAVIGLVIKGGPHVEVLNCVSLHGGLVGSWPGPAVTAASTHAAMVEHWRAFGLPRVAQFDNDTRLRRPRVASVPDTGEVIVDCPEEQDPEQLVILGVRSASRAPPLRQTSPDRYSRAEWSG